MSTAPTRNQFGLFDDVSAEDNLAGVIIALMNDGEIDPIQLALIRSFRRGEWASFLKNQLNRKDPQRLEPQAVALLLGEDSPLTLKQRLELAGCIMAGFEIFQGFIVYDVNAKSNGPLTIYASFVYNQLRQELLRPVPSRSPLGQWLGDLFRR